MTTDRRPILELASRQHGLFTTDQAATAGLTPNMLRAWCRAGGIVRQAMSTWAVTGAPCTAEQRALAAVLGNGPGAALCRASAAWAWRIPGHRPEPFDILRARGDRPSVSARSHSSRLVNELDLTVRRGIPVTSPVRTVFDLAGRQHPERTGRDLNHLMGRRLVTLTILDDALRRLAVRGRAGISVMRELIADAHENGAPAGSNLELVVEDILDAAGFRHMERQVPVHDDLGFIARVDFGDRGRQLAIEVDSDRFHHGLIDRRMDAAKTARMERLGWTVVRITESEIWWERAALTDRLRTLIRSMPRTPTALPSDRSG